MNDSTLLPAVTADSALAGKYVLLGMTGCIACYKSAELTRLLVSAGATVQVVMTDAATQFVTPLTLQALSGRSVYTSLWDARIPNNMAHIDLSRAADAILVAPATANFIAKLSTGLADDLLSTLCLARTVPLLVAPAMNRQMWQHPATQRNLEQISRDGIVVLGPDSGAQACGETGEGRMLEAQVLHDALAAFFQPKHLAGKRVLLTAGPTFEPLDPIRGLTNRSSGKMGFALARAAAEAGAQVYLVTGPTAQPTPYGVTRIDVTTAQEMYDAVHSVLASTQPPIDIFIAVAAVADWRAAQISPEKIKKTSGGVPVFALAENPDILASVAQLPDPPFCVGFAAESQDLEKHAQQKRRKKNIPFLIGNIGTDTFGRDDNQVIVCDETGITPLPKDNKLALARTLIEMIAARLPR